MPAEASFAVTSAATAVHGTALEAKGAPTVFCGLTVEYTDLDSVFQQLGMTREEVEGHMAPNARWPLPAHLEGWKLSHDAIRLDMDNFLAAISKTKEMVDAGQPLRKWQVDAFSMLAKDFYHNVHLHHDHEEVIFFPWMETRVKLPPKMSSDHKTLMAALDRVRELCCSQMKAGMEQEAAKALLLELLSTFADMRSQMRQHLEEEEVVGLPMLRKHFTAKDCMVPEKKIVADLKPSDMAWFLRPMEDKAVKAEAMSRVGIPGLIQKLVMFPAVKKDAATNMAMYRALARGEEPIAQPTRGFLCFAA